MRLLTFAAASATVGCLMAGAAAAAPPAWTVNKAQSRINFSSTYEGAAVIGQFDRWNAQIAFDPKDLAHSKATVTIETGSAKTGDEDANDMLPSNGWFAASRFPTATFTATGFRSVGGDRYEATGNLSLKGATRPVVLSFTFRQTGKQAVVDGTSQLNRAQFNVGTGQFQSGDAVPLNVQVRIHLVATRP